MMACQLIKDYTNKGHKLIKKNESYLNFRKTNHREEWFYFLKCNDMRQAVYNRFIISTLNKLIEIETNRYD